MTTSMEDSIAQKILKALDKHGEAHKKMGGCFTRLEESKLKKPSHVETRDDEEEVEEWEKDRAKYERNKKSQKLTVETITTKEKMEKIQLAFRKAQGMDDYLYNMGGGGVEFKGFYCIASEVQDFQCGKFGGTGDPKKNVRRYLSIVEIKGLAEKQTLHAFPLSLTRGAARWYYSLDPRKTKLWNELVELFVDQFIFSTITDVTLWDLETTKQGVGETFSEYMTRWKTKASRMVNRPNKRDQINMIIKNLLLDNNSRLFSSSISSFGELCDYGTRIEELSTMDN
ncbi:hypothetical protein SO802_015208 [Lithocarpus litseifolius]|uniref:Retrotransposon gag domain-containing protein n=1 Tax=Lithocarpus litseifolius TaxID=425828 RepID=A0AAW2CVC7_9ROSI